MSYHRLPTDRARTLCKSKLRERLVVLLESPVRQPEETSILELFHSLDIIEDDEDLVQLIITCYKSSPIPPEHLVAFVPKSKISSLKPRSSLAWRESDQSPHFSGDADRDIAAVSEVTRMLYDGHCMVDDALVSRLLSLRFTRDIRIRHALAAALAAVGTTEQGIALLLADTRFVDVFTFLCDTSQPCAPSVEAALAGLVEKAEIGRLCSLGHKLGDIARGRRSVSLGRILVQRGLLSASEGAQLEKSLGSELKATSDESDQLAILGKIEKYRLFEKHAEISAAVRLFFAKERIGRPQQSAPVLHAVARVMALQGDVKEVLMEALTQPFPNCTLVMMQALAQVATDEMVGMKLASDENLSLLGQLIELDTSRELSVLATLPSLLAAGCERHSLTAFTLVLRYFERLQSLASPFASIWQAAETHLGKWVSDELFATRSPPVASAGGTGLSYYWVIRERCTDVNKLILKSVLHQLTDGLSEAAVLRHFEAWSSLVMDLLAIYTTVDPMHEVFLGKLIELAAINSHQTAAVYAKLTTFLQLQHLNQSPNLGPILTRIIGNVWSSPKLCLALESYARTPGYTDLFMHVADGLVEEVAQLVAGDTVQNVCAKIKTLLPIIVNHDHSDVLFRFLVATVTAKETTAADLQCALQPLRLATAVNRPFDYSRFISVLVKIGDPEVCSHLFAKYYQGRTLSGSLVLAAPQHALAAQRPSVAYHESAAAVPSPTCNLIRRRTSVMATTLIGLAPGSVDAAGLSALFTSLMDNHNLVELIKTAPTTVPLRRLVTDEVVGVLLGDVVGLLLPWALLAFAAVIPAENWSAYFRPAIERRLLLVRESAHEDRKLLLGAVDVLDRCDRPLELDRDVVLVACCLVASRGSGTLADGIGARYGLMPQSSLLDTRVKQQTDTHSNATEETHFAMMDQLGLSVNQAKQAHLDCKESLHAVVEKLEKCFKDKTIVSKQSRSLMVYVIAIIVDLMGTDSEFDMKFDLLVSTRVSDELWLLVHPQLVGQLHRPADGQTPVQVPVSVRYLCERILVRIGQRFPHEVLWSLLCVAEDDYQSQIRGYGGIARILEILEQQNREQVREYRVVVNGLVRLANLPGEELLMAIETASGKYYQDNDIDGCLAELNAVGMRRLFRCEATEGETSLAEKQFLMTYGDELREAKMWTEKYKRDRDRGFLDEAWRIYYAVYQRLNKEVKEGMSGIDLGFIAPELVKKRGWKVAVPGTEGKVLIQRFNRQVRVMNSKQRPRLVEVEGDDGKSYRFLLKGKEALTQDQRVMQVFGLMNELIKCETEGMDSSAENSLLKTYAAIPLSDKCGLIEWVPQCDTMHSLIKRLRETGGGPNWRLRTESAISGPQSSAEFEKLKKLSGGKFDQFPIYLKAAVFSEFHRTCEPSLDIQRSLLMIEGSCEFPHNVRTTFSRSLAVSSIAGYVLGVGDRHPSNVMIHRTSGRVVHIDFGDLFEVNYRREKFPERIPFRLTRQLVEAADMTAVKTEMARMLQILRRHRQVLEVMIELFVKDPSIQWTRKPQDPSSGHDGDASEEYGSDADKHELTEDGQHVRAAVEEEEDGARVPIPGSFGILDTGNANTLDSLERMRKARAHTDGNWNYVETVMNRLRAKLDGGAQPVEEQVDSLIQEATDIFNLAQCYVGWCPFW